MKHLKLDGLDAASLASSAPRVALLLMAAFSCCAFAQSATPEASDNAQAQTAAAQAQNPIAHVISVPFQDNLLTRTGPYRNTANTLLIQPVVPIRIDSNWSLITRTIIPVVHEPRSSPERAR